jgi:hypothetical protein
LPAHPHTQGETLAEFAAEDSDVMLLLTIIGSISISLEESFLYKMVKLQVSSILILEHVPDELAQPTDNV